MDTTATWTVHGYLTRVRMARKSCSSLTQLMLFATITLLSST
ncbi:hypothetical protein MAR_022806, partial [Mya arenaria]